MKLTSHTVSAHRVSGCSRVGLAVDQGLGDLDVICARRPVQRGLRRRIADRGIRVGAVAYLGIGLAAALLYAMTRAHRRQHRGLTLTSMAVGIAATLLALSYLIDAPGISEGGRDLSPEIGVWLALVGGLLWAAGSALFAKEIEGDDHLNDTTYGRGRAA
jgi:hypothetical protein